MTVMLLMMAVLVWVAIAFGLAGGWKSTGGAVYTASGAALTVALGGQALVRSLAPRMNTAKRRITLALMLVTVSASAAAVASLLALS